MLINGGKGPKAPGEKERTGLQLGHAALYLVAQSAHLAERHLRRIGQLPVDVALPGEHGTGIAAAHRHDEVGPLDIVERDSARLAAFDVDPHLATRFDDLRVHAFRRVRPGRARLAAAPLVERLSQLGPAGVLDAHEEDARKAQGVPPSAKASCSTASGTSR